MNRSSHLKSIIVAASTVILLAAVWFLILNLRFKISEEEVTKITYNQEFEIPKSFHKEVLGVLDKAWPHQSEIDWKVLGELRIETESDVVELWLFSAGEKMVFKSKKGGSYQTKYQREFIRSIEDARIAQTEQ